jgi:DNA ligase-1
VALADKYDPKYVDFKNETWFASRKLDGVRCIIIVNTNGLATSWSRQGKQFDTLSKVEKEIEKLNVKNVVFDGELCLMNKDGSDDFQGVMKQIRRKDHTIENPKFKIFDTVTLDNFNKKESNIKLNTRLGILNKLVKDADLSKVIEVLKQELVTSEDVFNKWSKLASNNNWEGFMLRKDAPYKGKRSRDLLKVKTMHDAEYEVVDATFGPFRHVKDGKEVESVVLSAVIVEHKGNKVNVGSGFSFAQRELYVKHPEEIIGKIITVQYFEESQNQKGEFSLRFPVVKCIYENGRDV